MRHLLALHIVVGIGLSAALPARAQNADERLTLIILDLQARNTDKDTAALVSEVLGTSFEKTGIFQVRTEADVQRALNLEANKEAFGCDTDSCLAEIAGAMGAQFVAHGTVGALGNTTLVTVSLYEHAKAKSLGRERIQVEDKGTLPAKMDEMVEKLVAGIEVKRPDEQSDPGEDNEKSASASSSPLFWTGAVLLGIGGATAAGLGIWAAMLHAEVADGSGEPDLREQARSLGQMVTIGAIVSGVVAVFGGGLMAVPLLSE
jgi:hypothetical protein